MKCNKYCLYLLYITEKFWLKKGSNPVASSLLDFITHLLFLGKLIAEATFALQQTSKGYPVRLCVMQQGRTMSVNHSTSIPTSCWEKLPQALLCTPGKNDCSRKSPSHSNRKLFFEAGEKQGLKS